MNFVGPGELSAKGSVDIKEIRAGVARLYYVLVFLLYNQGLFSTSLSTDQIISFCFDFRIYALLQQWLLSSAFFSSAGHHFLLSVLHFPCVVSKCG